MARFPTRIFLAVCATAAAIATALHLQAQKQDTRQAQRARMVESQLKAREIRSAPVLNAMTRVPRHLFVPEDVRPFAYDDRPLPIGLGQTISQPYIVAYMTEALQLEPGQAVLEIGTGSGYQAAVLAEIAKQVYTIEIIPDLATRARQVLEHTGYRNVEVRSGNGYLGLAGARSIPPHHRHSCTTGNSSSARRSARGRRHHGRAGRHRPFRRSSSSQRRRAV